MTGFLATSMRRSAGMLQTSSRRNIYWNNFRKFPNPYYEETNMSPFKGGKAYKTLRSFAWWWKKGGPTAQFYRAAGNNWNMWQHSAGGIPERRINPYRNLFFFGPDPSALDGVR